MPAPDGEDRKEGLRTGEERFRLLVEQVRDYAIFMLDPKGHIATWNTGAERLKQYRASEIIGRHFSTFYRPEDEWKCAWELEVATREGRVEDEGWRVRKDGTLFWANVVITALRDATGELIGFGKVTRDLTERKKAEEQIRQSEERFRLLVENVRDYAIFMLDPNGCVATWNVGAERMKGYRADEIVGQHFSRFYPEEDVRAGKCELELAGAARDGRFEDEGWRVRKDGTLFWANVILTALRDARGELVGFAKVTRDLTEHKRAEEERVRLFEASAARDSAERVVRLLSQLNKVSGALAAAMTPEEVAKVVVAEGAAALRAGTGVLVEAVDGRLQIIASHGLDEGTRERWQTFSEDAATPAALAYRTGEALWVESPEEYARLFPALASVAENAAAVALPLAFGDKTLAVVGFRFAEPRAFTREERSLMQTMAAQAAAALDRAHAYEREIATARRIDALRELSEALSRALSTEDVARVVTDLGSQAAGADTCMLYTLDDARRTLELIGERGVAPALVARMRTIGPGDGNPVYGTLETAESMWVETPEAYASVFPAIAGAAVEGPRAQAFWGVPLVAEGRTVGLLGMGFFAPRRFPPDERRFVATFARQCAEALVRARRLDAERVARTLAEKLQVSLSTTLRSIGDAVIVTGPAGRVVMMNPVAEALTGFREREAEGRPVAEVFRALDEQTRQPLADGAELAPGAGTWLLQTRDGRELSIDATRAPIRDDAGASSGTIVVFRDVTAAKRDESRRAFLAEAVTVLTETLEYETSLAKLTALAVPRLADWCAVDVVEPPSPRPKRIAVEHVDPAKVRFARELHVRYPPRLDAPTGVPRVLRTGESELYPEIPDAMLAAATVDDEHLRIGRELGLRSAMIVPLVARGRVLGAISFVYAESGRSYSDDDLRFAEDLARRCAVAIDNARLYASEQQARQSAEVASRAKDEFLAVVSHELRTPLNAIVGWAKMMMSPAFDESRHRRAIETIERNAVAMAQLIEDLLDMSRMISGKMRLDVQHVELARVVDAAVDSVRPAADAKEIGLATKIDGSLPVLLGDPHRLQQVVWNLLSNAVKFTSKGGRVDVVVRRTESWAEICVSDTGKGIAPDFLPHVFAPFRQEDASFTRSRGGLGLGLAITRQLVELHGGRIEARSEGEGHGATFSVLLPISAVVRSAAPPLRRDPREVVADGRFAHPRELRGLRVLVVDDEQDSRELVKAVLEECDAKVTLAGSVDEALVALAREVPDVILSDVGMPERDGYDLIREVRRLSPERGGDVPAAALTAYARAEDRRSLLNAGFSMHIPKPVEPDELVAIVVSLTRFSQRPRS